MPCTGTHLVKLCWVFEVWSFDSFLLHVQWTSKTFRQRKSHFKERQQFRRQISCHTLNIRHKTPQNLTPAPGSVCSICVVLQSCPERSWWHRSSTFRTYECSRSSEAAPACEGTCRRLLSRANEAIAGWQGLRVHLMLQMVVKLKKCMLFFPDVNNGAWKSSAKCSKKLCSKIGWLDDLAKI